MLETIRYDKIIFGSEVDGPGRRVVLFMQGCPIRCAGCQSPHLWDGAGGREAPVAEIAAQLLASNLPITISGGEPFFQPEALATLVAELRGGDPAAHILVYSGHTVEQLLNRGRYIPEIRQVLNTADVLVDGPYIAARDHDGTQWRGSDNQRPIDLAATRAAHWRTIVTLDWDTPTLIISQDGNLLAAADYADLFLDLGSEVESRRCGQSKPHSATGAEQCQNESSPAYLSTASPAH